MNKFLTGQRREWIDLMFMDKPIKVKSGKSYQQKLYIPVGVNELIFKSVEKRKTKNGNPMYVFTFYKPPKESRYRATKKSYKPIQCFHIVGSGGRLKDLWYRGFTTQLSEKQLEGMRSKVKSRFNAVVKQRIKFVRDQNGKVEMNMGGEAKWVDCEVVSVHQADTPPEINHLKLFEIEEK